MVEAPGVGRVEYIRDLLEELRTMAESDGAEVLASLVGIAVEECRELITAARLRAFPTGAGQKRVIRGAL